MRCFFGPRQRIGEASHPGPGLDDPDADPFDELDEHLDGSIEEQATWDADPSREDSAHLPVPAFLAARKFCGREIDMVYKVGARGFGYYKDSTPVLELLPLLHPLHSVPPVVLQPDALLNGSEADAASPGKLRHRRLGMHGLVHRHADLAVSVQPL